MKVIPIPQSKRFNTISYQQNPVHTLLKQEYDTVSFGAAFVDPPSINISGDYNKNGNRHLTELIASGSVNVDSLEVDETLKTGTFLKANSLQALVADIGSHARVENSLSAETLTTGSWLEARELNTQNANIGDYAHITGKVTAEKLTTSTFFEAGELDAQTVMIGESAKITGKAKATLLVAGNYLQAEELDVIMARIKKYAHITGKAKAESLFVDGDLNIGSTDIRTIVSRGDVRFKDIIRLDKLTIADNFPNPTKNLTRTLLFDSANIIPEKIKIVLGNIQELVIHTVDKSILNKLEFFHQNAVAEGGIGEKLLPEAIERLVKFI